MAHGVYRLSDDVDVLEAFSAMTSSALYTELSVMYVLVAMAENTIA